MLELSPSASGPTSNSPSGGAQAPRAVTVALAGRRLGPSLVAGPPQPGVELVLDCPLDDQLRPEPGELRERPSGSPGATPPASSSWILLSSLAVQSRPGLLRPGRRLPVRVRIPPRRSKSSARGAASQRAGTQPSTLCPSRPTYPSAPPALR